MILGPKGCLTALLIVLVAGGLAYDQWAQGTLHTGAAMEEPPALPATIASPQVKITTLDGKTFGWNDIRTPLILVHFWASWCTPCRVELPALVAFASLHADKLTVIAVSTDEDLKAMETARKPFADAAGMIWVWDRDRTLSLNTFGVLKVPETIIMDQQRRLVDKMTGATDWAAVTLRKWLP